MHIIACGLNHKTAPVALREKAVFFAEKMPVYFADLSNNENIKEAVLLSTCNRSEIYCYVDNPKTALDWYRRQHPNVPSSAIFCYEDQRAIEHIISVACGLDSMVLGEPEILGQMKNAFSESIAAGSVNTIFHRLFQQVFAVAKEVRSATAIGACPVSIASATMHLLKEMHTSPIADASLLFLGAGDTIQLMLTHLSKYQPKKIFIANRNLEKIKDLKSSCAIEQISLTALADVLPLIDIVITATASQVPIITTNLFKKTLPKALTIVDLAVPRDVAPDVSAIPSIQLFSIDDLKNIIQKNQQGREHAAQKAFEVVKLKSQEFMMWLEAFDKVALTIRAYRKQIEELCDIELTKALRQLDLNGDAKKIMAQFAYSLTNKMMHIPCVQLRQAGEEGRFEMIDFVRQLFAINVLDPA